MLKDIIYNNLSQGLQFGSRWILNVALISILDIESYAVFSFVYSLSNILMAVFPFGSSVYLIAEANDAEKGIKIVMDSIIVVSLLFLVTIGLYIISSPFLGYVKGWSFAGYGIILSYILSLNLIVFSYFKGIGDFKKELHAYAIFCIVLVLFTGYGYFIAKTITDIRLIFLVLIGLNIVVLVYSVFFSVLKKHIFSFSLIKSSVIQFGRVFNERLYFGLQEIVTAIYTQAGLLILFYILDEKTYGYYRALFVIVAPVFMVTVAISQVILKNLKSTSKDKIVQVFRKIQLYTIVLGMVVSLMLVFLRKFIFIFIEIEPTKTTIIAFFMIIAITLMRFVFANYEMLLVVYDKQKQRFQIMLIAAVASITSIFILLPQYGLVGAVSTNAISYGIVVIGLLGISEYYIRSK